jgi:Per os infectivity factor 3
MLWFMYLMVMISSLIYIEYLIKIQQNVTIPDKFIPGNLIDLKVNCLQHNVACSGGNQECESSCASILKRKFNCISNKCSIGTLKEQDSDKHFKASLQKCQRKLGGFLVVSTPPNGIIMKFTCTCLNPMYYNGKYCSEPVESTCREGTIEHNSIHKLYNHENCACPSNRIKCASIDDNSKRWIKPLCLEGTLFHVLREMGIVQLITSGPFQ